ncbi:MAG: hypothetical protein HYR76_13620 [Ignavibacteria bacterium]|nr:hypothetical protein [Ignavibacteria bacterium]MBI3765986.1 hypothetical protein [Ignavibacteriales bacterium]
MRGRAYCAIIGDMNRSRMLKDRGIIQRRFQEAVKRLNKEFKDELAAPFVINRGDEFQGLLKTAAKSYQLIRRFEEHVGGVPFAFGIGIGALSTPLTHDTLNIDGEAFHRARSALERAKRDKRKLLYDVDDRAASLVNALIGMVEKGRARLTPRQKEITQLLRDHKQKKVAARLKISQQAVSKAASSSNVRELIEAENSLNEFFRTLS